MEIQGGPAGLGLKLLHSWIYRRIRCRRRNQNPLLDGLDGTGKQPEGNAKEGARSRPGVTIGYLFLGKAQYAVTPKLGVGQKSIWNVVP